VEEVEGRIRRERRSGWGRGGGGRRRGVEEIK